MKKTFENSFSLFSLLKHFVAANAKFYKLHSNLTLHSGYIISKFIERNNHMLKSNEVLSNLLHSLLDSGKYDFSFAQKN
jgi:hypothetical protein